VKVHYVGKLEGFDSKNVFDSSRERNQPFTLVLGQGQVIPGWEMGLEGMKKGELRRLSIPHYLAYGDKAQGDKIPAKSRLFFEVELLDFITPGELKQTVKKQGSGEAIHAGELGNFHYTGWSDGFNGKAKFDSSRDRGTPIPVKLGAGQVIQGWDLGLLGMKPGEVRLLEIPYNLAYGERGKPPSIPGYATLYFEVEYVGPATPPTPAPAPQAPPTP
jgi:FKBP-type peptidyl-prolyl cis-trans isomerase